MEINYLRGACGVTRWEDESNETMYEICKLNELWCSGVVEKKYF